MNPWIVKKNVNRDVLHFGTQTPSFCSVNCHLLLIILQIFSQESFVTMEHALSWMKARHPWSLQHKTLNWRFVIVIGLKLQKRRAMQGLSGLTTLQLKQMINIYIDTRLVKLATHLLESIILTLLLYVSYFILTISYRANQN